MPTVLRRNGLRFYHYSHEPNEPPHVHIDRGGASAKIWLHDISLASNTGFSPHELGELLRLVRTHRLALMEAWDDFFGTGTGG